MSAKRVANKGRTKPVPPAPISKLTRGERNIRWIERYLIVPEGKLVGTPVKMRGWQRVIILQIYDNPKGTRRAIISFGRKNGKTALAACLLLLHLVGPEARQNSQLLSAAQSKEQASLTFKLAMRMVRMSPELSMHVKVMDSVKELHCPEIGTEYKAISAEASTAYGKSPVFIIHDELGQVKGPYSELYEALETATGAQADPLSIIISTQAATDADLLSILIDDAMEESDPRTVLSLFTAPLHLDAFGRDAIMAANPAYGDFQNAVETDGMAADAKRMPAREPQFRNLILNQRTELNSPFLARSLWEATKAPPEPFGQRGVYIGLDLSEVNDLTAAVAISPRWCDTAKQSIWDVVPTFWLPEVGLLERSKRDRVPYLEWARQGLIQTTPGPSIEYEFVAQWMRYQFDEFQILGVGFDRWNWRHFKPWVQKAGFTSAEIDERFVEFGQGFQSMTPALRSLESDFLRTKIAHGDHPVLKMCAVNAVVQSDPAGNRKLAKNKSSGRIDGMVALAIARGVAGEADAQGDEYVSGGVIFL